MVFEKDYHPQFRDADRDGCVGLRGYMNYFQDMATHYMHDLHKGNDTLPEEYGIVWMYTKYKMHVSRKTGFAGNIHMETWIPEGKLSGIVRQHILISRNGEEYARGCLESCLYHTDRKRLVRLKEIDFPTDIGEHRACDMGDFQKFPADPQGMEYIYTHRVRYTDLDKLGHMTNLKYVDLFLNAFDSRFFEGFQIRDFELHFLDQCFEGENIQVFRREIREGKYFLLAVHEDQRACAVAEIS